MGRGATLLLNDTTFRIELLLFLAHRNLVVALGIRSPKNVDTGYDPCQFAGEQGLPSNLSKVVHNPLLSPSWWNLKMMVSKKNILFPQCHEPGAAAVKLRERVDTQSFLLCILWVVPLPSNSHHQEHYTFSRGSV